MTPVMSSELSATVTLSSYSWGTRIDMNCTYGVDNSDHESDSQADDKLAMVVWVATAAAVRWRPGWRFQA